MSDEPLVAPTGLRRAVIGVTGVAALLRLGWVLTIARPPKGVGDPLFYLIFAERIASGDGYVSVTGHPTAYYPPGYPYFLGTIRWVLDHLGLAGRMVPVTLVVQALLGAATAGMLVMVAARTTRSLLGEERSRQVGLVAGSIVAIWPNLIAQAGLVLSEPLFLFLFVALLLAITSMVDQRGTLGSPSVRNLVVTGALFALCTVVRPQSTLFLLPLMVLIPVLCGVGWRVTARITGSLLIALAIVLVPWTIRNAVRLHAFVPLTTNTGDNLCLGFNPDANGGFLYNDYCVTDSMYLDGVEAEIHQNREKTAKAIRWARGNPTALVGLSAAKIRITMENDVDALWGLQSFGHDVFIPSSTFEAMKTGANLYYRVVAMLAAAGVVVLAVRMSRHRSRDPVPWLVLMLIPAGLAVPVLSFGDPRFKAPLVPSLAILAAISLMALAERLGGPSDASAPDDGHDHVASSGAAVSPGGSGPDEP